jgi:maltooligosyltrehalose trehalohydrolase
VSRRASARGGTYPHLGAVPVPGGVRFRVWAPTAGAAEVVLETGTHAMTAAGGGIFEATVRDLRPGARYRVRVDGGPPHPDPASRYQPEGVHGPSMIVDPSTFAWTDGAWSPPARRDLVFYELHVGTFSPEGTFDGARRRLPHLRDLGVTAVELMPIADFPGRWNWGYDPAALFAPSRAYGAPDDLRALVNDAHGLGLAVVLDVVYNHFGPDGAYAPAVAPRFFSKRHSTPWGPAINLDGPGAAGVRRFFVENAIHWLAEYHLDGLRLDATHALIDRSPVPFLHELAHAVRRLPGPRRVLVAEDHRNLATLVRAPARGGDGLDAVWSDDYHHQMRRILAGDRDGYFVDFTDTTRDLAATIRRGWLFDGQPSQYFGRPRGTDPSGIPLDRFVHFIQNHDQIGNRPRGDRLTAAVGLDGYRAASALLLFAPALPLLFMGQEWAAATPFRYFTDHAEPLGSRVREGRRHEFRRFGGFAGEVPDPQEPATFALSRLDWTERDREPHAGILRLYRDLLALRPRLRGARRIESPLEGGLIVRRGPDLLLVALRPGIVLPFPAGARLVWSTEDARYGAGGNPPHLVSGDLAFPRPAAALGRIARA